MIPHICFMEGKMKKYFLMWTILISILCAGCSQNNMESDVLLCVNGEKIFDYELQQISEKYSEMGLEQDEIIEGMILEVVTLQQAKNLSLSINQNDVDERLNELKNMEETLFYEKAIEQYGTEDEYKKALYNKMLYNKMAEFVIQYFEKEIEINRDLLKTRTNDYISEYSDSDFKNSEIDKEMFWDEVYETYFEYLNKDLADLYFKMWQYKMVRNSEIVGKSYNNISIFENEKYGIDEDRLLFRGTNYELNEINLHDIRERFGSYFYLSNSVYERYGEVKGKGVHIPEKNVRALYLELGESPIIIKVIIAPILSYYSDFQGNEVIRSQENGRNKIEYLQKNMGIYYEIISDMSYSDMEELFNSGIPYLNK